MKDLKIFLNGILWSVALGIVGFYSGTYFAEDIWSARGGGGGTGSLLGVLFTGPFGLVVGFVGGIVAGNKLFNSPKSGAIRNIIMLVSSALGLSLLIYLWLWLDDKGTYTVIHSSLYFETRLHSIFS